MKVKVRKRKPAPVGKEQASKTIDIIKDEFNGEFGVPKEVSLYYRYKMLREEMHKVKEAAKGNNDFLSCCNNSSASLEKTEKAISSNSYPFLTHDIGGRGHRKAMQQAFDRVNDIKRSIRDADRIIELPENEQERIFAQSIIEMMFKKIIYKNDAPISLEKRLALVESLCSFDECKNTGTVPAQCAYFDAAAHIKSLIGSIRGQL